MTGYPSEVGKVTIYAGDTFTQTFNFLEEGAAIELASVGWSGWDAQYRKTASAANYVDFTVDDSDAENGAITISLTATQTAALPGDGVFDLKATQGGTVRTWLRGSIVWTENVTRG